MAISDDHQQSNVSPSSQIGGVVLNFTDAVNRV